MDSLLTLEHWVLCAHHGCCDNCALRDKCESCESFHVVDIVIIVQIVVVSEKFAVVVNIVVGCSDIQNNTMRRPIVFS